MQVDGVDITFLGHSGFLITTLKGKKIAIDPYEVPQGHEKVDMILVTHSHYDHCHVPSIMTLAHPKTIIVITMDCQSKVAKLEQVDMQVIEIGDELDFGDVRIEAVPAYNIGKDFHPEKEGWVGYIIKLGNVVIYHAGDTDKVPEMERLTGYSKRENKFIALLPVSGKTVMNAEEAADAAFLLKPYLSAPMHYGAGVVGEEVDAERFVQVCQSKGLNAQIIAKV